MMAQTKNKLELLSQWKLAWPKALAVWSRFTRLSDPRLCLTTVEAAKEGMSGSFAMIRLFDKAVFINLEEVSKLDLDNYAIEVLAHEIGHHILAPANPNDHFLLMARIRKALPTQEHQAAMVANLYTDLLINDKLQRRGGLRMSDIYFLLNKNRSLPTEPCVWALYMRIYEHLWQIEKGDLSGRFKADAQFEIDSWLGSKVIRVYASDWLIGAGRFATLLLPYLMKEQNLASVLRNFHDTKEAAKNCEPSGLTDIDEDEKNNNIHPAEDPLITDKELEEGSKDTKIKGLLAVKQKGFGQRREPFEYGEILKSAGINLTDHEIAIRYYREAALPYLIPFPVQKTLEGSEPLIEGLEPWELGSPFDQIDWMESLIRSPIVFPGLTTVQRQFGNVEGENPSTEPIDLDIYVDSSGSMPNPQATVSYLALAGAIITLSALRVGARVQATLWSGTKEFITTDGFVQSQDKILSVLVGYFGGATAFPIHILRETFIKRKPSDRPCHILMISDDGITTMFDKDEKGNSGWDISSMALKNGRAGGTMALNMVKNWETYKSGYPVILKKAREEQKWKINTIEKMEDLIEFARAFSKNQYQQKLVSQPKV